MSTIGTISIHEEIATFAASVRLHLDDLPAEDVDDLVDGLEADLTEQALDIGDEFETPDAEAYADELRSAAGLPPRGPATEKETLRSRLGGIDRAARARYRRLRARPAVAATVDFLLSLRPAWWLLRAVVVFETITVLVRGTWVNLDLLGLILLTACVVVSVQWGRGRWAANRGLRATRFVTSVGAAVMLPILALGAINAYTEYQYYSTGIQTVGYATQPGLTSDGSRVRNIFVYDSAGQPLTGVQLFDQDGRPLATVGQDGLSYDWQEDEYFFGGGGPVPVSETGPGLQPVWNIYPLRELPAGSGPWNEFPQDAALPTPPFSQVPAVGSGTMLPTPQPTATSFGEPSPAPTATPIVEPFSTAP